MFWWMRLDLVLLVGRTVSGGVFWGVCELIMILGSLSANGWCCVPVLLIVWPRVSSTVACWSLSGVGLSVEMEISGKLLTFDITWSWEVSGGPMSSTQLSHLRGTSEAQILSQSTKTFSATWLKRKERKKKEGKK